MTIMKMVMIIIIICLSGFKGNNMNTYCLLIYNKYFIMIIINLYTMRNYYSEGIRRARPKATLPLAEDRDQSEDSRWAALYRRDTIVYCQLNFEITIIPIAVRHGRRILFISATRRSFIGVHVW